jgi:hypothetical protein
LFTVVGGLAMLRMKAPTDVTFTYLLTTATMFVIVFGFSLFGIRAILLRLWIPFLSALLALIGPTGLYYLSHHASRRVLLAVIVVVALGYPMTMAVAESASQDSPAFQDQYPRFSYTESEIAAVETISTVYPPGDERRVYSDHPYQSLFGRLGGYTSEILEVDQTGPTSTDPVIHREYQTTGPALMYEAGEPARQMSSNTVDSERVCSSRRNHVYTNDVVKMCTTSAIRQGVSS